MGDYEQLYLRDCPLVHGAIKSTISCQNKQNEQRNKQTNKQQKHVTYLEGANERI